MKRGAALAYNASTRAQGLSWRLLTVALALFIVGIVSWAQPAAACGKECQKRLATPASVQAAMQNLANVGILQAVNSLVSNAEARKDLIAIAIHETGPYKNPLAKVNSIGATCAYQIMPNNYGQVARLVGMRVPPFKLDEAGQAVKNGRGEKVIDQTTGDFEAVLKALTTDPAVCVKAGQQIYDQMMSRGSWVKAVCGYGGQCVVNETCCAAIELNVIKAHMDGRKVEYTTVDKLDADSTASPDANHGDIEVRIDGQLIGVMKNCQDLSGKMSQELARARQSYQALTAAVQQQVWVDGLKEDAKKPTIPMRGSIIGKHCLDWVIDKDGFFKALSALFTPQGFWGFVGQVIRTLVMQVLDVVCSYVAAALNNILTSICLPLPRFGFRPPSFSAGACNGLSLADLLSFSSNYTPGDGTSPMPEIRFGVGNGSRAWTNIPIRRINPRTGRVEY